MGTMNESEARRAALTAAVTVNATWNMEEPNAILALAERFETWLLRPGLPGVEIQEPDAPAPEIKTTPLCIVCHHTVDDHDSHGCGNGRGHLDPGWGEGVCTCPYRGRDLREGHAQSYVASGVPRQRASLCALCGHERHENAWCSPVCACLGGPR